MKAASIHDLKKELDDVTPQQAKALCLRLARFKNENKELLTYLLFEAHDEQAYIQNVTEDISTEFQQLPNLNPYYLKKSLRRVLRMVNKQARYSGIPTTELALRIHFCEQVREHQLPMDKSPVLTNLYQQQLKKINQILAKLEEDLQLDYRAQVDRL